MITECPGRFYKIKGSILFKKPLSEATNKIYSHYLKYGKIIIDMSNVYVSFEIAKKTFRFIATAIGSEQFARNIRLINVANKPQNILEGFILEGFERHNKI